jgi:putative ABC transport system permease protein
MRPPTLARRYLTWLAPATIRATFLDDLEESFARIAATFGERRARRWYYKQALGSAPWLLQIRARQLRAPRPEESHRMSLFDTFVRDLRHAWRVLVEVPGFTVPAVTTLALAIGANSAIFSLLTTLILRPLPYDEPDRLTIFWNAVEKGEVTHLSLRELVNYRQEAQSVDQIAAYVEASANLTGGTEPERVRVAVVTGNLFATLGVRPLLGRTIVEADAVSDTPDAIVIGHGLWVRRFGGSSDIVGQTVPVNGRMRTIVGVMPPGFRLPADYRTERPSELWTPLFVDHANLGGWGSRSYFLIARIRPDATPAAVTSELKVIGDRWIREGYVRDSGDGMIYRAAVPLPEFISGDTRRPMLILSGAVVIVLLVACANVANLLLARADVRRREVAIRVALGATSRQLIGQLLTESAVLSMVATICGLGLAWGGIQVLIAMRTANLPRVEEASLDATAVIFTAGIGVITTVIFGLVPAIQLLRTDPASVMRESGRSATPGRTRLALRGTLVVAQLACSVVLVVGAGLLVRSLIALYHVDLGFKPGGVLTALVQLPLSDYRDAESVVRFYRQLSERLEALPGVAGAGAARVLPLARNIGDWSITIEGRPTEPNENPNGDFQSVTPGYFRAFGVELVRGRLLTATDHEDAAPVVVINETMAARYWPDQDAIGKRFRMGGSGATYPFMTIVGIVRGTRHNAVVESARAEMYLPHAQLAQSAGGPVRAMAIVIKSATGEPLQLAAPLRATVRAMDRNLPLAEIRTMDEVTAAALAAPRFAALLLGVFASVALILAAIGLYGTISLLVTERSHEIGIRMALGASRGWVVGFVLRRGLALAGIGILLGIVGALLLTRLLSALIYGVGATDPVTFIAVPVVLGIIVVVACLRPARRAASLDPLVALRDV